jgi:hypothetical protein
MVIGTFYFNGALSSIQEVTSFHMPTRLSILSAENQRFKNKMIDFSHHWNGRVLTDFRFTGTIPPGF